jgi:hypothetical protein
MKTRVLLPVGALLLPLVGALALSSRTVLQDPVFERYFEDRTMRVDYYHTGSAGQEIISLERVVSDGPWAGSRTRLLDGTNLGKYLFEVVDRESGQILYSRGFATIFGEWETTSEAGAMARTFHESLRFPWPRGAVKIVLHKRDERNDFRPFAELEVDPADRHVNRGDPPGRAEVWTLLENGPASRKVDLVLLAEGYTAQQLPKFHDDARRLVEELFSLEPFRSRRSDFNVRAIDLVAGEAGVTRPHAGQYRRNPVGAQYSIFDSERYLLTYDNRTLRDVLSPAPYDFMAILVNEKQYGGGGIHNFQMATSVDSEFSGYVFVHEFGHHFAGLGDEYYTSDVAYETGDVTRPEPWEPNVTALQDPAAPKWGDLVEPATPVPTPWDKEAYEEHARRIGDHRRELIRRQAAESEFDALFRGQRQIESRMLSSGEYYGKVGAFEGASYEPTGLYRPEVDCIMFSRNRVGFCQVCRWAIERVIDLYAGG